MPVKDMKGMRFSRLLVLGQSDSDANGNAKWNCVCDCGTKTTVYGFNLRNGESSSCGCYSLETLLKYATKHGQSHGPEWTSWSDMKRRCFNKNMVRYPHYGGRGITVCDQWIHSFETFLKDMGPKPTPKYTLERVDNDGNYEPSNCRWATRQEQNHNRQQTVWVVYKGKKMSLMQAIRSSGNDIWWGTVKTRIDRGWPVKKAIETPSGGVARGTYSRNP